METPTTVDKELLNEVVHGNAESLAARIQQLLLQGADPNNQNKNGRTPLHLLLSSRQDEFMSANRRQLIQSLHVLLKGGALVDKKDWAGQCSVHLAASMNMPSEVLLPIIRKCSVDKLPPAVVHKLMSTDNLDITLLVLLCQSGIDLTLPDDNNITAVHRMVEKHRTTDMLLVHTLAHERPEDFNKIKDRLLFHACLHGSKETMQALLQLGASQDSKFGQRELPALLLAASSADSEEAVEKVDILLAGGADIHETSSSGQNLCHIAAIQQNARLLEKAFSLRVDHDWHDVEGNTPLHYACTTPDNSTAITLLVDAGLDIDEANSKGLTPLYLAVSSNHVNNVIPLIGADVNIENAGLEASFYRNLHMLAQPEVIKASPKPLEFALHVSSFYEQMASNKPRLKEHYMELSTEMENVAIDMADGLQSTRMQRLAVNGEVIEMALNTTRKRFIANEAVQQELHHIWEEDLPRGFVPYTLSLLIFIAQIIARPIVIFVVWPLIASNIKVFGRHLSWHILYPRAPPIVWFYADAFFFVVFFVLLLVEALESEFSASSITVFEWLILVYVLAFIHNYLLRLWRAGQQFISMCFNNKSQILSLAMFVVFFALRFVGIYSDVSSPNSLFRVSKYVLVPAVLLTCLCLLDYLQVHPRLGPIQKSFNKMRQETLLFIVILFIYLITFAATLTNIYGASSFVVAQNETGCPPEKFDDVWHAIITLFWSLFGIFEVSDLKNCEFAEEAVGTAIMALWLVQSFIVLLNILIALVTIKFEESQSRADIEWKFSKGAAILGVKKSQQIPAPFNLLHSIVDVLEWLFTRQSFQKRRAFSLAPFSDSIRQTLERGDASCIQVEIFRQAEEKKAMSQTGTKEDLEEITNRLQGMNLTLGRLCQTVTREEGPLIVGKKKEDSWVSYRRRLHKLSGRNECIRIEEADEDDRFASSKSTLCRMLSKKYPIPNRGGRKSSLEPPSVSGERRLSLDPPPLHRPLTQSNSFGMISQSNAVVQALVSLQRSIEQQGQTLKHIQTKLANMEVRMEYFRNKFAEGEAKFQTFHMEEDTV